MPNLANLRAEIEAMSNPNQYVPYIRGATVLALVEAVEAARAYYEVDWNGESEERFATALRAFDWGRP